jgi:hypothetical protein
MSARVTALTILWIRIDIDGAAGAAHRAGSPECEDGSTCRAQRRRCDCQKQATLAFDFRGRGGPTPVAKQRTGDVSDMKRWIPIASLLIAKCTRPSSTLTVTDQDINSCKESEAV